MDFSPSLAVFAISSLENQAPLKSKVRAASIEDFSKEKLRFSFGGSKIKRPKTWRFPL
ncbi:hypothetical protein BDW_07005 [Bdellovibrio bacteriovorus W]|nr:hypothetical protein BDW_07005 [Bdellovibrio bacteriovorus W]